MPSVEILVLVSKYPDSFKVVGFRVDEHPDMDNMKAKIQSLE
jgi:hypothetical protein